VDSRVPEMIEILTAVKSRLNAGHWMRVRECSLCNVSLHYLSHGNTLYYQSHCGCVRYDNYQAREWEEIEWYVVNRLDIINEFLGIKHDAEGSVNEA
jgi:hypothetical protein